MAKMFSLGDSLKSRLEIGVTGSFSYNWPVVGRAGDSERWGFPFRSFSWGGQEPPMHVGRARRMGQVRPDLGGAAGPTSS
jgi:hypothetical protein